MSSFTLRSYRTSDYEAVRRNLDEGKLTDQDIDTPARLEAKIRKDPESIRVAAAKDQVIGNVFIVEDGWTGFIFRLAVAQGHREKRVGTALVKDAEAILKGRGINQVAMFIDAKDEELNRFYSRQGYRAGTSGPYSFLYKPLV